MFNEKSFGWPKKAKLKVNNKVAKKYFQHLSQRADITLIHKEFLNFEKNQKELAKRYGQFTENKMQIALKHMKINIKREMQIKTTKITFLPC